MHKLSARFVETNSKPGLSNDGLGLYLKTQVSGAKSWIFRYSSPVTRKKRDMGLGSYPVITLAHARQETLRLRLRLSEGIDPIQERDAERNMLEKHQRFPDFASFAKEHHDAIKGQWKNKKHANQWINTLIKYAFPKLGKKQMADIDVNDVLSVLEPIWAEKTETATRVRQRIEDVLNAAKLKGYSVGENPARWKGHLELVLPSPTKIAPVKHHDAMPYKDLPVFMARLKQQEATAAIALEFLILTASRSSEVRLAVWDEFDIESKIWTLPKERMKAGREHRVPLSERCIEILESMHERSGFVFKGQSATKSLSDGAFRALLTRMGNDEYTPHGFRSSFRDWAAECLEESSEVIEMCLGHSVGSRTELAYKRTDLLEKRRACIGTWSDFLSSRMPAMK